MSKPKRPNCSHGRKRMPTTPATWQDDLLFDFSANNSDADFAKNATAIEKGAQLKFPRVDATKPTRFKSALPTDSLQGLTPGAKATATRRDSGHSRQRGRRAPEEGPLEVAIARQRGNVDGPRQPARSAATTSRHFPVPGNIGRDKVIQRHPRTYQASGSSDHKGSLSSGSSNDYEDIMVEKTPVGKPVYDKVPRKKKMFRSSSSKKVVNLCDDENSDTDDEDDQGASNAANVGHPSLESGGTSSTIDTHGPVAAIASNDDASNDGESLSGWSVGSDGVVKRSSSARFKTPQHEADDDLDEPTDYNDETFETPAARRTEIRGGLASHSEADDVDKSAAAPQRPEHFRVKERTTSLHSSTLEPSRKRSIDRTVDVPDESPVHQHDRSGMDATLALTTSLDVVHKKSNVTSNPDDGLYDSDIDDNMLVWSKRRTPTGDPVSDDMAVLLNAIASEPIVHPASPTPSIVADGDNASSPGATKKHRGGMFTTLTSFVNTGMKTFQSALEVTLTRKVLSVATRKRKKGMPIAAGDAIRSYTKTDDDEYVPTIKPDTMKTASGRVTRSQTLSSGGSGSSFTGKLTRRTRRKSGESVIEIPSSEDEWESPPSMPSATQKRAVAGVIRVAFGRKIFHSECSATFDLSTCSLNVQYKATRRQSNRSFALSPIDTENLAIDLQEPLEMKYFSSKFETEADDGAGDELEVTNFLAFQVKANDENGLTRFANSYHPFGDDSLKKYIVMEFRSEKEFEDMRELMIENDLLKVYLTDDSRLSASDANAYCLALQTESNKEKKLRLSASSSEPMSNFLIGRGINDLLLVYPFNGDVKDIDAAAEGLNELNEPSSMNAALVVGHVDRGKAKSESSSEKENEAEDVPNATKPEATEESRAELELTTATFERLEPGVYLNDTLIDFWCQWIWRNVDKSFVHIFTTHFFTTLESVGASNVTSWTKKRGVDVFKKKFIFIPVNKALHWSVCVAVNPGAIADHKAFLTSDDDDGEIPLNNPHPCLLFFDSLKAHAQHRVAGKVRDWLNSEWKRLKGVDESPFTAKSMKIYSPKVPYQDNSWDCGVYVCRYIYGMYKLRDRVFSYRDVGYPQTGKSSLFREIITESNEFDFNADDIVRIRTELRSLLERLSVLYEQWKAVEDDLQKTAIQERRKKVKGEEHHDGMESASDATKLKNGSSALAELNNASDSRKQADRRSESLGFEGPVEFESKVRTGTDAQELGSAGGDSTRMATEMDELTINSADNEPPINSPDSRSSAVLEVVVAKAFHECL